VERRRCGFCLPQGAGGGRGWGENAARRLFWSPGLKATRPLGVTLVASVSTTSLKSALVPSPSFIGPAVLSFPGVRSQAPLIPSLNPPPKRSAMLMQKRALQARPASSVARRAVVVRASAAPTKRPVAAAARAAEDTNSTRTALLGTAALVAPFLLVSERAQRESPRSMRRGMDPGSITPMGHRGGDEGAARACAELAASRRCRALPLPLPLRARVALGARERRVGRRVLAARPLPLARIPRRACAPTPPCPLAVACTRTHAHFYTQRDPPNEQPRHYQTKTKNQRRRPAPRLPRAASTGRCSRAGSWRWCTRP